MPLYLLEADNGEEYDAYCHWIEVVLSHPEPQDLKALCREYMTPERCKKHNRRRSLGTEVPINAFVEWLVAEKGFVRESAETLSWELLSWEPPVPQPRETK